MESSKLIFLLALFLSSSCFSAESIRITVDHHCKRPMVLDVSIKNESTVSISLEGRLIPWSDASRTLHIDAFAVGDGKAKKIAGQAAIADYFGVIDLSPMQVFSGEVSLARVVSDFNAIHKESDIVVIVDVKDAPNDNINIVYGEPVVLLIPKRGLLSEECPTLVPPVLSD